MSDPYTPPTTAHLGLPLPSPDAPSQREDVTRIAGAITGLDAFLTANRPGLALDGVPTTADVEVPVGRRIDVPPHSDFEIAGTLALAGRLVVQAATVTVTGMVTLNSGQVSMQ